MKKKSAIIGIFVLLGCMALAVGYLALSEIKQPLHNSDSVAGFNEEQDRALDNVNGDAKGNEEDKDVADDAKKDGEKKDNNDGNAVNSPSANSKKITQIPILYYHAVRVEEGNELCMPPAELEAQMKYLYEQGYRSLTLDELYDCFTSGKGFPEKSVVITFDDGYDDNYINAYPILKKYGFVATVFMISDFIDQGGFLSSNQISELVTAGWGIEGHTSTHADLSSLDDNSLRKELSESKSKIESITGKKVNYFAYPYGIYNTKIVNFAKESGYRMAFTTERGWAKQGQNIMLLSRVYCYAHMGMDEFTRRLTNPNY